MPTIEIVVKNKIATSPIEPIVCGNGDYQIKFFFDEEWAAHTTKTARFYWNGQHEDVVFDGDVCPVPVISGATVCNVGVFAGNLHTTTPALVTCIKSILCAGGVPAEPAPDVYAQLMERLNELETETDPTVPAWAKQPEKPSYTAAEVGALPADTAIPVVPANVSAFENDSGYQTAEEVTAAIEKAVPELAQPDWNAGEGELGHILNRPFYEEIEVIRILSNYECEKGTSKGAFTATMENPLEDGRTYHITWNGVEYDCSCAGGSVGLFNGDNVPFHLYTDDSDPLLMRVQAQGNPESVTLDMYSVVRETIHKLDRKFLPDDIVDEALVADAIDAYLAENPIKESDPTVPAWAKQLEKPSYTAQEVGALPADTKIPEDALVVNVSADDSTIPIVYYTDKTSAEINQARRQGKFVYCVYNNQGTPMLLYPSLVTESLVIFTQTIAVGEYAVIAGVSIEGSTVTPIEYNLTVPSTLPNPHALTFTGAVSATYDGSGAVSVEIPAAVTDTHINRLIDNKIAEIPSGGGGEWKTIANVTLEEEVQTVTFTVDVNGNPFALTDEIMLCAKLLPNTETKTSGYTMLVAYSGEKDIYGSGLVRSNAGKGVPATGQYCIYRYYKFNGAKNTFMPITIMEATNMYVDYTNTHGADIFEVPSTKQVIPVDKISFNAYAKMGIGSTIRIYGR